MPGRRRQRTKSRPAEAGPAPPTAEATVRSLAGRVRQIAFVLVLIGAMLGPFAPTIEHNLVLRLIVQMLFILSGALWVMSMALEGRVRLRRTGLTPWLIVLAGALLSGVVNASYKFPAVLSAFAWFSSMAAFVVIVNETPSRRTRLLVLGAVGATAFCVALHGLHQLLVELPDARSAFERDAATVLRQLHIPEHRAADFYGRIEKDRVFGTFLIPNSLAGFLVLVTPAVIGLLVDRFRAWSRFSSPAPLIWRGALLAPFFLAAYFTRSKAGWLAFILALAVFAVWGFASLLWRRRMHVAGVVLGLAVIATIAQLSGLFPPLRDYASSTTARAGYWHGALTIFEEHPFVGVGLDNFAEHYGAHKRPQDEEARRVHNDYLQLACETGLIGLLAYAAFLLRYWHRVLRRRGELMLPEEAPEEEGGVGVRMVFLLAGFVFAIEALCGGTFRSSQGLIGWTWPLTLWLAWVGFFLVYAGRRDADGPGRHSFAAIGMAAGLIGFFLHSFVDFNHYVGGTLQTAWILMALLVSARISEEREAPVLDRAIGPGARLGLTLCSAAVMIAVLYGFILPVADAHTLKEQAIDPNARLSFLARELRIQASIDRNPWDAHTHALRSDICLAMWANGIMTTARGRSARSEAIISAQRATEINPMRSEYFTRLGRLHELRWRAERNVHDYQEAMAAYRRAEELFPSNPDVALAQARVWDLLGQYEMAQGKYIKARRLSAEQIVSREFTADELRDLSQRIGELTVANTRHVPPRPFWFRRPRLNGMPRGVVLK